MDTVAQLNSALSTRYQIERELGRGGMATVYLARDVRHDRQVALKVLHPDLTAALGAERFLAEIRTTANLQHPHILPLFDSGQAEGQLFYVMPFVEGETLRARLTRETQLPIADALRIATETLDALQYAHEHGVIHRDVKPENILLQNGHAFVADFGIALAVESAGRERMTQTGLSLGTPQYMSPEQAMGERNVDARSDIYSLAAVLYEMLAGEPPFTGPSAQAIVAQVITGEPRPIETRRRSVPAHVSAALRVALDKLPADRFASAREFAAALATEGFSAAGALRTTTRDWRRPRSTVVLGAIAFFAVAAAAWGWLRRPGSLAAERENGESSTWLATLAMPDSVTLVGPFSIAQDGSRLVFAAAGPRGRQIWVREAGALDPRPVPGSDSARYPAISPDGRRIAYQGPGSVRTISVAGGSPSIVSDSLGTTSTLEWADDDHLLTTSRQGVVRMAIAGGEIERLTTFDTAAQEVFHTGPSPLPGGKAILFVVIPRNYADNSRFAIAVTDPGSAHHRILTPGFWARYVPPGYLLVVRPDSSLVAFPFDLSSRSLTGKPVVLAARVTVENSGFPQVAVSRSGELVYATGSANSQRYSLARVSRDGSSVLIDSSWVKVVRSVAVSPDGSRVAVAVDLGTWDVQIHDLRTGASTVIATPGAVTDNAVFSPDGRSVLFATNNAQAGVLHRAAIANPAETQAAVTRDSALALEDPAPSPDGRTIYYTRHRGGVSDIMAHSLDQPGSKDRPVVAGSARERTPVVSPNGKWLAYDSDESGHFETYVRSTDSSRDDRWQVSSGGGDRPRWSRDGRELFYVSRDSLISAQVASNPDFTVKSRRALFSMSPFGEDFDLFPNGEFLMLERRRFADSRMKIVFVRDWRDLLHSTDR